MLNNLRFSLFSKFLFRNDSVTELRCNREIEGVTSGEFENQKSAVFATSTQIRLRANQKSNVYFK